MRTPSRTAYKDHPFKFDAWSMVSKKGFSTRSHTEPAEGSSRTFEGHDDVSIRVHSTTEEDMFTTRTVCRPIVFWWSLESDTSITRYKDSIK
jgi:hypothetical protein